MFLIIYGSDGWIGSMFIKLLREHGINYKKGKCRVDDTVLLKNEIDTIKPTHIVSFIGRTHGEGYSTIDYLEGKNKLNENMRDNLFGPIVLAHECKIKGIYFVYFGLSQLCL